MSAVTTHILDTARGLPAHGVAVHLEREGAGQWTTVGTGQTNADGRLATLLSPNQSLSSGSYRLTFDTGSYFQEQAMPVFYPTVQITFCVTDAVQHYHIPLLLSPYGYSTYRGS